MPTAPSRRSITCSAPRVTVGGEYEMRHATVDELREFDLQNALATADWRIDRRLTLSGGAGYSWLATKVEPRLTSRAGVSRQLEPLRRPVGVDTSGIGGRSCRRSALAARSRTRNSRPASSGRSPAVSTGAPARRCVKPIR